MKNNTNTGNWFELLLINRRYKMLRHLLLQVIILLLSLNALGSEEEVFVMTHERFWGWITFYAGLNILCYLNIYLLAPRLMLTGRINKYKWGILVLTIVFFAYAVLMEGLLSDLPYQSVSFFRALMGFSASFLMIGLILFGTSTMVLFVQWVGEQKRIVELKLATKQSELTMLKQQINPHFLFNMLNNANVLLNRAPKEASQVLFRLEELLNYQLNDSTNELVNLDSDINFLNDFLNLEKIRRDRFTYSITKKGETAGIKVPPLLFIPFVENAVKHNPDNEHESYVNIQFEVKEHELYFRCENSKPEVALTKSKVGGLGLANIRRRLELLYSNRHTLSIVDEEKQFTVVLIIKE